MNVSHYYQIELKEHYSVKTLKANYNYRYMVDTANTTQRTLLSENSESKLQPFEKMNRRRFHSKNITQ